MATVPPKNHQPLHNFSLPFLKWGHRLHHRRNRNSPTHSDLTNNNHRRTHTSNKYEQNHQKPIVITPDKVNVDINGKSVDVDLVTAEDDGDVKPWNLRPRRLNMIDSVDGNGNSNGSKSKEENHKEQLKKKQRRLWISLSKEEIEEDVYAFTGSRPVRRPKKRNRTAQKYLDNVFPGLYLVGVSADSYRV